MPAKRASIVGKFAAPGIVETLRDSRFAVVGETGSFEKVACGEPGLFGLRKTRKDIIKSTTHPWNSYANRQNPCSQSHNADISRKCLIPSRSLRALLRPPNLL
jgi:hypothetical protein